MASSASSGREGGGGAIWTLHKMSLREKIAAVGKKKTGFARKRDKYCPPADREPPSISIGHWS